MDSEETFLGIIASGNAQEKTVHGSARPWSFFDLKGDVEVLLESLAVPLRTVAWKSRDAGGEVPDYYHPGVAAELKRDNVSLGVVGQLHPKVCESYKVKQPIFLAEIRLDSCYLCSARERAVEELPKFPAVQRDLSIVVDQGIDYEAIEATILQSGIEEIKRCFPFDLYFGETLPSGKKSLSISIVYQSASRTLTEEEVNDFHEKILNLLQTKTGAQLRT
jgi:phenylalanyl-tRNA synthetase beta chain